MTHSRRSGLLCHPSSMPSAYGIGDLGQGALRFIDYLASAGQSLWQVLPLGPTGYGDSPYQPFSAFAGNPLLIDPDQLAEAGLLGEQDLAHGLASPGAPIDYGRVIETKQALLRRSHRRWTAYHEPALSAELAAFGERSAAWLSDYALFMALKRRFQWASWVEWPADIALREPSALDHWRRELASEMDYEIYCQLLFDRQWSRLKDYANRAGIEIIGDMPIFVGHDSADVWAHRGLFQLDEAGRPQVVAGVPPDYFSPTGQLWGNPHYRWDLMAADGYRWWLDRLTQALAQVDRVRLDHFRGFSGYWEVPADHETAINGRWVRGPGEAFFQVVERELGRLPIIAEDLGLISQDVIDLRDRLGLPGMRVLQFAFDSDATNTHLPHNYVTNCLAYTGTHDNDTTVGWYGDGAGEARHKARLYAGSDGQDMHWALIRLALESVADFVIVPLQDVLGLGSEGRMNSPGRSAGNWTWRYRQEQLLPELAGALRDLTAVTGRLSVEKGPNEGGEDGAPPVIAYQSPFGA